MLFKFFHFLGLFSLTHHFLLADEVSKDFEEVNIENGIVSTEEQADHGAKSDSSATEMVEEKTSSHKKLKPHYAGARRPAKNSEGEKKNGSRTKNKWFLSKTHPKTGKKEAAQVKEDADLAAELPPDHPYYIKTSHTATSPNIIALDLTRQPPRAQVHAEQTVKSCDYPRSGFQAPNGHFFFTGEWIYWRTRQEGMEFATAKKVHFDFESGFRVGLGVHLPDDHWFIDLDYTRLTPESSEGADGSFYPLFLFGGAGISGSTVSKAHAHWKIAFQNLDVAIGRAFYIAKTVVLQPFFGLKGAWI